MNKNLQSLRASMQANQIDAYIIPNTDAHQSEYFADYYKTITWLSNFTGSNATVIITQDFAGLWTDGRYFLQADMQLKGTGFELVKLIDQTQPEYIQWIAKNLKENQRTGFDGRLFSTNQLQTMKLLFSKKSIQIAENCDLIEDLWEDRPAIVANEIYEHDIKYTGQSRVEKIENVRQKMGKYSVENYLITATDDIGWLFNIRGSDVDFNPVTYAFALISTDAAHLFIQDSKVPTSLKSTLEKDGVTLHEYDSVTAFLSKLENTSILLPAGQTNIALYQALPKSCQITENRSIVQVLKGIKNPTEQAWLRKVMVKDGVAMVRFLKWLEDNIGQTKISELSAATKLHECRAAQDLFVGDSFPAISGYKGNGAIIHYKVSPESDTELKADGIYLIDSGGQYLDGTTDITRTITLGNLTEEQKTKYTLVLKGHIGLATVVFPEGTRGNQLDILARQALWKNALNYRHGTGHGVGFFMNVHEGPQRIGPGAGGSFDVAIEEGMYSSNEPGYYQEGEEGFGIRIENLVITQKDQSTNYGQFFNFETITLCPMDNRLVDVEMLTNEERKWYNDYQQEVYEKLSSQLDEAEKTWLAEKCQAI
jgi:Xaa-Pro aminopeptidase